MYRRHVRARLRLITRRTRRFILHNVLHADDPPYRLALGVAIGLFVTFTPTIGFQMALTVFFAWLLGGNKVVGVPFVWISNPVTFVPIYYPLYRLGVWVTGATPVNSHWWSQLTSPPEGWANRVNFFWTRMMDIAVPLWVGCLVFSTILALVSYIIVERAVRYYRLKRFGALVPPAHVRHSQSGPAA